MCLVIERRKISTETSTPWPREPENPYVFKRKSYSTKRTPILEIPEKQPTSFSNKKVKKDTLKPTEQSSELATLIQKIKQQTIRTNINYFSEGFFDTFKEPTVPTNFIEDQDFRKINPMMKNQINIVSNKNQKISASIHQGLLLANTSHTKVGKDQHFLRDISNPFEYQKRNYYLRHINFQKDHKKGYEPIEMQQKNEQIVQNQNMTDASKVHFIRKKQSTLTLPRSCGVSYIKPSESFQKSPFEPLPPLIFQCSSKCSETKQLDQQMKQICTIFNNFNENCWLPFIQCYEDDMRNLLLGVKVGTVGWVNGIQNLWPLYEEGIFFYVIYSNKQCFTEEDIWQSLEQSCFKIGILVKKSTSGKKSFLKSLNIKQPKDKQNDDKQQVDDKDPSVIASDTQSTLFTKQIKTNVMSIEEPNHQQKTQLQVLQQMIAAELKGCRTVITLSLKLEMYVQQNQWKSMNKGIQDTLNYLVSNLKNKVEKGSLDIIRKRLIIAKSEKKGALIDQAFCKIRFPNICLQKGNQKLNHPSTIMNREQLTVLFVNKINKNSEIPNQFWRDTHQLTLQSIIKNCKSQIFWDKILKTPLYFISTRDSFAFDLIQKTSINLRQNNKPYKKIQYYFDPTNLPPNYGKEYKDKFPNWDVGVTCYHDFFTNQELDQFQKSTFETQTNAFKNKFLQMTVQPSIVGSSIKRTKFFFGYRYMWTRCQLAEPGSHIGAGVRRDVTAPPRWTKTVIDELVKSSIAQKDFINSIAINVYHDGRQGLAQHFDDAVRFRQPIYTLRLFSDARLSFGSQFYGFCNGAFIIPLPRGCICVMQQNSYAANGVKHCVRPCDMTGKSAAVILRQMHHQVVNEAKKYDEQIDFPSWVSTLSASPNITTFAEQKRRQSEYILNNPKKQVQAI